MFKVVCVKNKDKECVISGLEINKKYSPTNIHKLNGIDYYYQIIPNINTNWIPVSYFKTLSELRRLKINKILNV